MRIAACSDELVHALACLSGPLTLWLQLIGHPLPSAGARCGSFINTVIADKDVPGSRLGLLLGSFPWLPSCVSSFIVRFTGCCSPYRDQALGFELGRCKSFIRSQKRL